MSTHTETVSTKADRPPAIIDFWPRFLTFPIVAFLLYPFFVMGWFEGSVWTQLGVVAFLSYSWFCIGGGFHEAVHMTLFSRPSWNIWFGRFLGALILIPYTVYKESHRRHHAYLNTPDDYELWPYSDPRCSLAFRRLFIWIDLCFSTLTTPYIYGRIYFTRDPRLKPAVMKTITYEYIGILAFWAIAIAGLVTLGRFQNMTWADFNPLWIAPLLIASTLNCFRKFVEHLGMVSTDPMYGTRTIVPTTWGNRLLSYFDFDLAVHGPHHRYPKAQHYELIPRFEQAKKKSPESDYPQFKSYLSASLDTLPCLWNYPATGDHRQTKTTRNDVCPTAEPSHEIGWERQTDSADV